MTARQKYLRLGEMILLLWIAFSGGLIVSLFAAAGVKISDVASPSLLHTSLGIANQLGPLALLVYILARQGRTLAEIGLRLTWKAIPYSAALFCGAYAASYLWDWGLWYSHLMLTGGHLSLRAHNVGFLFGPDRGWSLPLLLVYAIINPLKEELIVRAYLLSEVRVLSGRLWLAVAVSVAVQISYHLYQGIWAAASYLALFLVFSLYYARTRDIFPVILAPFILTCWPSRIKRLSPPVPLGCAVNLRIWRAV